MTKLGEVILRDTRAAQPAAGIEGRLYYVTDELVLERDSGSAWQSYSTVDIGCRVYNSSNISINNNTATALTFDSERYDTDTMHSTSSNTGRITIKTAGKYIIGATVEFAVNGTNIRQIYPQVNGSTIIAVQSAPATSGTNQTRMVFNTIYSFAVNDYIELIAYQNSGGSLNVTVNGNYSPEFYAQKIG